jgi:molybdopterin-biosynthesis enzyme MoeA-like protein
MLQRGFIIILFGAAAFACLAQAPASPRHQTPWTLSAQDRVARRFDAVDAERRERAHRAKEATALRNASGRVAPNAETSLDGRAIRRFVVDGSTDPELFFPHELFEMLLTGFTPDLELRAKQREFDAERIRAFGYDEAGFWNALEVAAGKYVALKYGSGEPASEQSSGDGDELCRARFEALQNARAALGGAKFDRFLYLVIAPHALRSTITTVADPAESLLRAERGCQ